MAGKEIAVTAVAPTVGKAKTFGNDTWSIWLLRIGLVLILSGLIWDRSPSWGKKEVAQSKPKMPMNVCQGSEPVRVTSENPRGLMPIRPDCWSQTLFVPHGVHALMEGTPGGTEVCFWLNDECAEIKTLGKDQNLDWGTYGPKDLAMRFRGGSGIVLVELTGKNTETQ